jgi:hypothetical protein
LAGGIITKYEFAKQIRSEWEAKVAAKKYLEM